MGVNVTYFENGKTKLREVVSLNGTIKSEEMNEEGKLVSEKASRNQVPVGTWKYYWPDVRIPRQSCHRFQVNPATDSTAKLPPVPHESCH